MTNIFSNGLKPPTSYVFLGTGGWLERKHTHPAIGLETLHQRFGGFLFGDGPPPQDPPGVGRSDHPGGTDGYCSPGSQFISIYAVLPTFTFLTTLNLGTLAETNSLHLKIGSLADYEL